MNPTTTTTAIAHAPHARSTAHTLHRVARQDQGLQTAAGVAFHGVMQRLHHLHTARDQGPPARHTPSLRRGTAAEPERGGARGGGGGLAPAGAGHARRRPMPPALLLHRADGGPGSGAPQGALSTKPLVLRKEWGGEGSRRRGGLGVDEKGFVRAGGAVVLAPGKGLG